MSAGRGLTMKETDNKYATSVLIRCKISDTSLDFSRSRYYNSLHYLIEAPRASSGISECCFGSMIVVVISSRNYTHCTNQEQYLGCRQ